MRFAATLLLLALGGGLAPAVARAQGGAAPATAAEAVSVFLDCEDGCDSQLIRTEIAFVNWVRDRTVADVHVLVTSQDAGGGGDRFTLAFIGQRAFAGRGDTLTYTTNATTTSDEERRGVMRMIAIGLMPFVARTPAAQALRITMPRLEANAPGMQTMPSHDPWRAWVFEIDISGDVSGEQNYRNRELDAEFNANRTTAEWKTVFEASYNFESERAIDEEYDDQGNVIDREVFTNLQRNWNGELVVVKSLTGHLSAGFRAALGQNTFRNQKRRFEFMPAVEYNVFHYDEATRRRLAFQFATGVDVFRYQDTTIFDKLRETFPMYYTAVIYATRQPWGESGIRLEHSGYLNDTEKRSTELSGNMSVRLFRGFSVRFGGGYSWIHNQVYLPKGERDQADVLLRRRALLTGFEYNAYVGLTYTFGSIFNNVVNPRFF
ncbi:MAG: hypothetical protein HUU26_04530 [Gemmatimonadaceae bacterium]|nr:hypothetical protein [Gemmatimonadaceae bacterium]